MHLELPIFLNADKHLRNFPLHTNRAINKRFSENDSKEYFDQKPIKNSINFLNRFIQQRSVNLIQTIGKSGFIMTCSSVTVDYCLQNLVFGGREGTYPTFSRVNVGDIGFLINVTSDDLYGIFEATSKASLPNAPWKPEAYGGRGAKEFPVQILVKQIYASPKISNQSHIWGEVNIPTYQFGKSIVPKNSILTPEIVDTVSRNYFHWQLMTNSRNTKEKVPLSLESVIRSTFVDLNALHKRSDDTFYVYDYHKKWMDKERRVLNPKFDAISGDLLKVKGNDYKQVERFAGILKNLLNPNNEVVICVMPSHQMGLQPSGIRTIATRICGGNLINGTNCVIRSRDTSASHTSGMRRTYADELGSLSVQNNDLIRGKPILLLDDVTTTGVSFRAGKELLTQAGASMVICLALGMTVLE